MDWEWVLAEQLPVPPEEQASTAKQAAAFFLHSAAQ